MERLLGKTAIITGAAGEIGATAAKLFVHEGAKVHLVDIDEGPMVKIQQDLGADRISYTTANVADEEDVKKYVKQAVEALGKIDIFLNNAGIEGEVKPIVASDAETFDKVMAVNVRGAWLGLRYVLPEMEKADAGSVVMTSSVAGVMGTTGVCPYVTSKHALIGMMRTAAKEAAEHQIRVNSINPGPVDSRMMQSLESGFAPGQQEQAHEGFVQQIPLQRYATAGDVAKLMLFLASDDSRYITGAVHMVDGGMTA